MARTVEQIQADIIAAKNGDATLSALNSPSATAIWRLWTFITATAIWTLEVLFDTLKAEITDLIAKTKPHTVRWYQQKSLLFQYGKALVTGADYYDNSALTPTEVEEQKIVKQAAATEEDGRLYLKVAKEVSGELEPLASPEFDAYMAYIFEIKDAGVKVSFTNAPGDKLKLALEVRYDPLILGADGARLDGTDAEPVKTAILNFLKNLPFNGQFIRAYLVDAVQKVEGVLVPETRACSACRHDVTSFANIDISYQPFSGYLRFAAPSDLIIIYNEGV